MNSSPTPDVAVSVPPTGRGRWKKLLLAAAGVFLLVVGGILWLPSPRVPLQALTGRHDAGGHAAVEGAISDRPLAEVTSVALAAQTTTSSGLMTSRSDGARFTPRTLAILNSSDHLLMQRVGLALFEALHASRKFTTVHYLPAGEKLPAGELLPDLFITLQLDSLQEEGIPLRKTYNVVVRATLGNEPAHSNSSYNDELTPPVVNLFWNGEVRSEGKLTGLESSGARYQSLSAELSKSLTGAVTKVIDQLRSEAPEVSESVPELTPAYQPPPDFEALRDWQADKLMDGRRLMCPNVTLWRFESTESPGALWRRLEPELQSAGWQLPPSTPDEQTSYRARRGSESIELFTKPVESAPDPTAPRPADPPPRVCWVLYTQRLTREELLGALRELLARGAPESSLLLLHPFWQEESAGVEKYFEQHPPRLRPALQRLADWRLSAGRSDDARDLVLQASALQLILGEETGNTSLVALGKKVGLEKLPSFPAPGIVERLGLVDLRQPHTVDVRLSAGSPLVCLLKLDETSQSYLLLHLVRGGEHDWLIEQRQRVLRDGGSSTSLMTLPGLTKSGSQPVQISLTDQQIVEIRCEPTGLEGEFELHLTRP